MTQRGWRGRIEVPGLCLGQIVSGRTLPAFPPKAARQLPATRRVSYGIPTTVFFKGLCWYFKIFLFLAGAEYFRIDTLVRTGISYGSNHRFFKGLFFQDIVFFGEWWVFFNPVTRGAMAFHPPFFFGGTTQIFSKNFFFDGGLKNTNPWCYGIPTPVFFAGLNRNLKAFYFIFLAGGFFYLYFFFCIWVWCDMKFHAHHFFL